MGTSVAIVVDLQQLVGMTQELVAMGHHGVQSRRLAAIALNLMMSKAVVRRQRAQAPDDAARRRAQQTLAFLHRLEGEVVRLYGLAQARQRRARMGVAVPLLTVGPG